MKKILFCSTIIVSLMTSGAYAQKNRKTVTKIHPIVIKNRKTVTKIHPIVIKTGIGEAKPPDFEKKKSNLVIKKEGAKKNIGSTSSTGVPEDVVSFKTNFEKDVKCRALPLNAKVNIDFEDAPLYDVLKFVACLTQRNFIIGGPAASIKRGKQVTILSTSPVTVYEAYKAFLSALHVNNMTIIPKGAFWEVVQLGKSRQMYPLINGKVPDEDRIITHIIQPKHVDAADIDKVLEKFKTRVGEILVYEPTNTLIITDLASNVKRMAEFVAQLDVPTGKQKIWVRPVQYADASDLVKTIQELFGKKGRNRRRRRFVGRGARGRVNGSGFISSGNDLTTIMADDRTNQLIVVATSAMYMKIDKLLRKLDVPVEGEGQIHVYYLENANAKDVSSALSGLTGSHTSRRRKGRRGKSHSTASLFEGEVKITAYKPTNSLIIESSLKDFLSVKKVIERLDVRRKQVYVEAMILEISSNKSDNFGLAGSGGKVFNLGGHDVPFLMGMGGLGMSSLDMKQLQKGGVALGMQGPLLDVSTGSAGGTATSSVMAIPTYGFILQALAHTSRVNILSTPNILTMDNQEAEIVVGKQIPYQESSYGGLGGLLGGYGGAGGLSGIAGAAGLAGGSTGGLASSALSSLGGLGGYGGAGYVQRLDVDLSLKITPQISESNYVRLKIDENVQDVESMDAVLGPTTSKRKVTNTVVVKDQQPVVIGGLIRDVTTKGVDKVPILGDIPIFGQLFRKNVITKEKRNLLMIIIPYIINDPSDLRRIYERKELEMKKFARYMSTKEKYYSTGLDYRKKFGLLERINKAVNQAKQDEKLQDETKARDVDIVGPPQTHALDYNPLQKKEK